MAELEDWAFCPLSIWSLPICSFMYQVLGPLPHLEFRPLFYMGMFLLAENQMKSKEEITWRTEIEKGGEYSEKDN